MRKIRNAISFILIAVLLLSSAAIVSAEETQIDWANYDWENFSATDVSAKEWGSMCKWLPTEADIKLLFDISMKVDGYKSEGMGDVLFKRFQIEPANLIMALSAEEEAVQEHVISSIVHFGIFERAEFAQFLSNLTLPEDAGAGAVNILVQMVQYAEETWNVNITNWPSVDWATIDWHTIDFVEWANWLDEADLKSLFQMTQRSDGAYSEVLAGELGDRFKEDPVGLILALSAEKEEIQTQVIHLIIYNGDYHRTEFEQLMSGLKLPEDAGTGAVNILVQMVRRAEETWNMNITNPHTGDPIGFAALLIAVSGLGIAVLVKRRKPLV